MRFTWLDPTTPEGQDASKYIDADRVEFAGSHVVFRDNEHAVIRAVLAHRVDDLEQRLNAPPECRCWIPEQGHAIGCPAREAT